MMSFAPVFWIARKSSVLPVTSGGIVALEIFRQNIGIQNAFVHQRANGCFLAGRRRSV
jgi:hypothetical protein